MEETQKDLMNKKIRMPQLPLTAKQLQILSQFYRNWEDKPLGVGDIYGKLGGKVHINTVRFTMKIFEQQGMIQRTIGNNLWGGRKAHTTKDKRYKFYIITKQGILEYENHQKTQRFSEFFNESK